MTLVEEAQENTLTQLKITKITRVL
jgi:hypothetical protein